MSYRSSVQLGKRETQSERRIRRIRKRAKKENYTHYSSSDERSEDDSNCNNYKSEEKLPREYEAIIRNPPELLKRSYEERCDATFIQKLLCYNVAVFDYVAEDLQCDEEFIRTFYDSRPQNIKILKHMADELQVNKEFIMDILQYNGQGLEFVTEDLREDPNIIEQALINTENYSIFKYASKELQHDASFVLRLLKKCSRELLNHVPLTLIQTDKELLKLAIPINDLAFESADETLQEDKEIAHFAIRHNRANYRFVARNLAVDTEVISWVIEEAQRTGEFDESDEPEKEIWREIIATRVCSLSCAPDHLKNDRKFILSIVSTDGMALCFVTKKFQTDKEIILAAVKQSGFAFFHVIPPYNRDRNIFLEAVKSEPTLLEGADEELLKDREIIFTALISYYEKGLPQQGVIDIPACPPTDLQTFSPLQFASKELCNDEKLALQMYYCPKIPNDDLKFFTTRVRDFVKRSTR